MVKSYHQPVMVSFCQRGTNLDLSGKKESQQFGLQANLLGIFLINDGWDRAQAIRAMSSLGRVSWMV